MEKRGVVPVPVLKRKCLENTEIHTGVKVHTSVTHCHPLVAELDDCSESLIHSKCKAAPLKTDSDPAGKLGRLLQQLQRKHLRSVPFIWMFLRENLAAASDSSWFQSFIYTTGLDAQPFFLLDCLLTSTFKSDPYLNLHLLYLC